jgi:hypothetical protein
VVAEGRHEHSAAEPHERKNHDGSEPHPQPRAPGFGREVRERCHAFTLGNTLGYATPNERDRGLRVGELLGRY